MTVEKRAEVIGKINEETTLASANGSADAALDRRRSSGGLPPRRQQTEGSVKCANNESSQSSGRYKGERDSSDRPCERTTLVAEGKLGLAAQQQDSFVASRAAATRPTASVKRAEERGKDSQGVTVFDDDSVRYLGNESERSRYESEAVRDNSRRHRSNKRPKDPFLKLFTSVGKPRKAFTVNQEDLAATAGSEPPRRDGDEDDYAVEWSRETGKPSLPRSSPEDGTHSKSCSLRQPESAPTPSWFTSPLAPSLSSDSVSPHPLQLTAPTVSIDPSPSSLRTSSSPIAVPDASNRRYMSKRPDKAVTAAPRGLLSPVGTPLISPNLVSQLFEGSGKDASLACSTPQSSSLPLPLSAWVRAPDGCEYHTELKRRVDAGQLLHTPYEELLQQCMAAVLAQRIPFDGVHHAASNSAAAEAPASGVEHAPKPTSDLAEAASLQKPKALYLQWRSHRLDGEDIAMANNRHNADPYLGILQHRLSVEWRLELLYRLSKHIREAFHEEQQHIRVLAAVGFDGIEHEAFDANPSNSRRLQQQQQPRYGSHQTSRESSVSLPTSPRMPQHHARSERSLNSVVLRDTPTPPPSSSTAMTTSGLSLPPPPPSPVPVMAAQLVVVHWYRKINLCQLFEDLFADTVQMAAGLPLFMPDGFIAYYAKKRSRRSGLLSSSENKNNVEDSHSATANEGCNASGSSALYHEYVQGKARARYLRECPKQVWQAEKDHARELLSSLLHCWRQHHFLREEIRSFEQLHRQLVNGKATNESGHGPLKRSADLLPSPMSPTPTTSHPSRHAAQRGEPLKPLTILEMFELAGVKELQSLLLATLHGGENAAAAAAALDSLTRDARRAACSQQAQEEDEDEEQQLLTAQNLSPSNLSDEPDVRQSSSHADPAASFDNSFAMSGSMRRIKVMVGSPLLVNSSNRSVSDFEPAAAAAGAEASVNLSPSLGGVMDGSSGSLVASRSSWSVAAVGKREKHVTFVLEPTIFDDAHDDDGEGNWCGGDGAAASATGRALAARQSKFSWKRYYDEKNEVGNVFAKRSPFTRGGHGGDSMDGGGSGSHGQMVPYSVDGGTGDKGGCPVEEDLAAIRERLRAQRQRVLQLFFKLDEDEGTQHLVDSLYALRHADEYLRNQVADIEARIAEIKRGGGSSSGAANASTTARGNEKRTGRQPVGAYGGIMPGKPPSPTNTFPAPVAGRAPSSPAREPSGAAASSWIPCNVGGRGDSTDNSLTNSLTGTKDAMSLKNKSLTHGQRITSNRNSCPVM